MGITTGYLQNGNDIGSNILTKDKVISIYPNLDPSIKTPGLWLWGSNILGQLGDGTIIHESSPVQTISGGTNWKQVSGNMGIAAIKTDGTLWLWGDNSSGQLGDNTRVNKSSPVQTISGGANWMQVSCSSSHTAAIKTDGTLWLWGDNGYGELGNSTITHKSSPVQTISGGTNWKQVSCGNGYTAAIKTDGTLWLWGNNGTGQLCDNTIVSKSSPVQTISGGTNWKQVSCGSYHTAAIKTDGTLWLWGFNNAGQLGDGTVVAKSSPVQAISLGTNWKSVACGGTHTAAIKTDGTLWLWGDNASGRLGDNTAVNKSSPVQTISQGTNWKSVSCGDSHTAAIKTDGTLWLWGNNGTGQLCNNTVVNKSSPVQTISQGTNWKSVSCGGSHTASVKDGDY